MSTAAVLPISTWPEVTRAIRNAKILVIGEDDIKNEAQAAAAVAVIQAFGGSPAGFIYFEPCTARTTRRPPDIVMCHPEYGVVVFEVKGYSCSQIESVNAGNLFVRHQGYVRPINAQRQADDAMFDIKNQVERATGLNASTPAFNSLVVLPNVSQYEWNARGFAASYPAKGLILRDDLEVDKLKAKLKALVRRQSPPLTPQQIKVVKSVFGDSATINEERQPRPDVSECSLGAAIDELATMDKHLSAEQTDLSRLTIAGFPRLIRGVAGSGKTVVLANLAARLLNREKGRTPELFDEAAAARPLKIAVICFNRSLVSFLRQKIKDAYKQQTFEDIPPDDIMWVGHLNSLVRKVTYGGGTHLRYIPIQQVKDAAQRATEYCEQIDAYTKECPTKAAALLYDAIFVDEGQDFEPEEFHLLLRLLKPNEKTGEKNLIIFYDDAQNLYGRQRPNWKNIGIDVARGDRAKVMKECFRNTREIVQTAFNLLLASEALPENKVKLKTYADVSDLRQAGLVKEVGGFYEVGFADRRGEYPTIRTFRNRTEEKEWIASEVERLVKQERVRPEDILIVFNYALVFDDMAKIIRSRIGTEYIANFIQPYGNGEDRDSYIFKENCLTISTVHGAKGYDAYVVFLAGVDTFQEDEPGRASLYVGATRAKLVLYMTGLNSHVMTEARQVVARARVLKAGE